MKIKKWLGKLRIFKRMRFLESKVRAYQEANHNLKGMLMNRRKTIKELKDNLLKTVNDLNLLEGKKKKGEIYIAELTKRRDEFLRRVQSPVGDANVDRLEDYKFFLSEPFIVDKFEKFVQDTEDIDGDSATKGLGIIFEKLDEKKEERLK